MIVYAVCSTDRVQLIDTYQYADPNGVFLREPYCVKFRLCETGRPGSASVSIAR